MSTFIQVRSFVVPLALLLAAGCGSHPNPTGTTLPNSPPTAPIAAHTIFVTNTASTPDSVLEFSATASGSVTPTATITGPANSFFTYHAVDASGNVYVANESPTREILVYAAGATGATAPVRTISGANTNLRYMAGIAVDPSGQIYVSSPSATPPSILVFAANANGNVAPIQTISSAGSMMSPGPIAADASNVYIADQADAAILVFPSSANGSESPARTIQGSATDILQLWGLTVDAAGDIYANNYAPHPAVLEFASGANGNIAPVRTISGVNGEGYYGVAVDSSGTVFTAALIPPPSGGTAFTATINIYASGSAGAVFPVATITSPGWQGCDLCSIAVN